MPDYKLVCCTNPCIHHAGLQLLCCKPTLHHAQSVRVICTLQSALGTRHRDIVGLLLRETFLAHPSPKPVDSITCI